MQVALQGLERSCLYLVDDGAPAECRSLIMDELQSFMATFCGSAGCSHNPQAVNPCLETLRQL